MCDQGWYWVADISTLNKNSKNKSNKKTFFKIFDSFFSSFLMLVTSNLGLKSSRCDNCTQLLEKACVTGELFDRFVEETNESIFFKYLFVLFCYFSFRYISYSRTPSKMNTYFWNTLYGFVTLKVQIKENLDLLHCVCLYNSKHNKFEEKENIWFIRILVIT